MNKSGFVVVILVLIAVAVIALFAANLQHYRTSSSAVPVQRPLENNTTSNPIAVSSAQCHSINFYLPDPNCTPGAIDPRVTQTNIHQTICVSGYTQTVRPSTSITNPMKLASMKAYGYTDSPSNYEYDHLVPLELGGAPQDPKNLWPEPGYGADDFKVKDKLENYLHKQVCSGAETLSEAQQEIAQNWVLAAQKAGLS